MILFAIGWTLMVGAATATYLWLDRQHTIDRVTVRAKTLLERDMLYRSWGVTKGGIYVKVSENHQPNPHLAFLPNRDIHLPNGTMLTLMTPSNITQQAFELSNQAGETLSKITAIKVVNPANAADGWELAAINAFEQGAEEQAGVGNVYGKPYVRYMRPFVTEEKCLKCHSAQGYDIGQIRGGLSVSIPLAPALAEAKQTNIMICSMLFALWGMGMGGISWQCRKLKKQTELAVEHERQRDHAEMSLHYMTNYDQRTNLPNRYLFEERLRSLVDDDGKGHKWLALVCLEMRNFRRILETTSSSQADKFLKVCAERIAEQIHSEDVVARIDENRLMFTLAYHEEQLGVSHVFKNILNELSAPVTLSEHVFYPVPCLGVAFYPNDSADVLALIKKSSAALDRRIEKGEGGFELFSESLQAEAMERLMIENGLRMALLNDQFRLHFQPQVNARTGEVVGAEALLRWQNDDGDLVPPNKFIPIAEESGLIIQIGEWVVYSACRQAAEWYRKTGRKLQIGVNVSAKQFLDPALPEVVEKALKQTGLPPECLEIEITESTFIGDIDRTIETLTDLKIRGVKIAIDDFGTGYSSLNYLKKFPIDRLKIDRSFIIDIAQNEDDRVIVSMITGIADKLGLDVIAEGVEDNEQLSILVEMACSLVQGFIFSRPLPTHEFEAFMDRQNRQSA